MENIIIEDLERLRKEIDDIMNKLEDAVFQLDETMKYIEENL